ncbi:magnesium/cobalt transporter CorA [Fulvivirga sedimenti]|uniref:Magnesium transport protein CorA n=1 Tax=Fulvivirga sedimenti TaxID=2879465 RepID=A0A9X1HKV8_9BACT|nr:magnesium/cobalt transporter CorA [Fulvivirga sedimenti]MCA6073860.1 magnesium/cobalt transporter CorA [Fulvivirga sedimenti]
MQVHLPKIPKTFRKKSKTVSKAGLPPGTLVHIGPKKTEKQLVELIQFDQNELIETDSNNATEILEKVNPEKVNWINIDGLHNIDLIQQLGNHFHLSPLMLEDILNTEQRPKLEEYDGVLFLPMKALNTLSGNQIEYEQISFVLGSNYILSFQEKEGDLFDQLRNRISDPANRVRSKNVDYLFYRLIDTVVDNYYIVMEHIGEQIEDIEEEVYLNPTSRTMQRIQDVKKELIILRKSLYPIREAISSLLRNDYKVILPENRTFYNDVYDHIIQLIDMFETYRDLISNLMDMYMSTISNKMNEIMKVLTIISTIFIPLSFIAGVYGMNFQHMPELNWRYGYFAILGLMLTILGGMLFYFRRKKWL